MPPKSKAAETSGGWKSMEVIRSFVTRRSDPAVDEEDVVEPPHFKTPETGSVSRGNHGSISANSPAFSEAMLIPPI